MRLFVRANLEGRGLARRYSFPLTERILRPIIGELRHQVGLPEFADQPLMRGERELAMTLHGGIMFIGIRRHIYRMPLPEDIETLVSLQVRTFLAGAPTVLAAMHEDDADPRLTIPLIENRRDR